MMEQRRNNPVMINAMLHNIIHSRSIIVSKRRNAVLSMIKDALTASSASSSLCSFQHASRLMSSSTSPTSVKIFVEDETITTSTTTIHGILNNEEAQPHPILPTRRSGRRRNPQQLLLQLQQQQQPQRDNKPLLSEVATEATRSVMEDTVTTVTAEEPDMSVMDEEISFSQVQNEQRRRLDVAIVGLPNAGKSQLLNILTQSPVAAVSRKRHTTRHGGILGARTVRAVVAPPPLSSTTEEQGRIDDTSSATATMTTTHQLVFVDTPGFMKVSQAKKEGLDGALVSTAANVMQNVDFTLLVVDAAAKLSSANGDSPRREAIVALMLQALASQGRSEEQMQLFNDDDDDNTYEKHEKELLHRLDHSKYAIVLNKVDLVSPKSKLLDIAIDLSSMAKECLKYHRHQLSQPYAEHDDDNDDHDYRPTRLPLSTKKKIRDISSSTSRNVDGSNNTDDDLVPNDNEDDSDDDDSSQDAMPMFFYISALKEDGVDDLLQHLLTLTTPTYEEWPVEPGQATQLSDLDRVEEIIREKLYRCLHKEVPYAIQQENRLYEKRQVPTRATSPSASSSLSRARTMTTILTIHQDLRVWTKSHRELVRGRGDQTLERIRETATRDLEKVFNCKVQLHLNVKLVKSKNDPQ